MKRILALLALTALSGLALQAQAQLQPASPSAARIAFAAADLDHDGSISLDEFQQDVLRSWRALDVDRDGYVSLKELIAATGSDARTRERLRQADTDHDGRLSFKEVVAARMRFFDEADANHDDRLSLNELLDYLARQPSPKPEPPSKTRKERQP
jgi:Ca2+-binding EF-hand superfamily protein